MQKNITNFESSVISTLSNVIISSSSENIQVNTINVPIVLLSATIIPTSNNTKIRIIARCDILLYDNSGVVHIPPLWTNCVPQQDAITSGQFKKNKNTTTLLT
jgi:hypothetical protein